MIEFRSKSTVSLVDCYGSDARFVSTARVSTARDMLPVGTDVERFLNFLVANRHGSPFEHAVMTFRVETPIFVAREFMRHRI